jgi:hypothetical protein
MSYCSPNINVTNHYTCFEHDELKEIALALNIYIQKNKLCLLDKSTSKTCSTKIINIGKKTKKQLWYSIYNRLKIICPYEYCWVDLDFINNIKDRYLRDKIRDFTFKPKGPKTANSWLWTEDINRVLQQYGSIDKTFKFLGALPSDFYKITKMNWTNICNYNKFSIVFNLDNHKQSGSHWVAFLIDNKTKTIEYYSIGNLPNTNINVFIKHVQNFLHKKCKTKYEILYNTTKQQYENNECGMFAIHFIITRLLGKSFHDISNMKITDKDMNRFRKIVFRPKVERKTQKLNYIKINF